MKKADSKTFLKIASLVCLCLLVASLVPLMIVGFYSHPNGDDYYYGQWAMQAWRQSGDVFNVVVNALVGTVEQYNLWQGTYSAMFLMHIPPYIFGDFFYGLYPTVLLSILTFGLFYMFKPIVMKALGGSVYSYLCIASLIEIMFLEQVPLCAETFYWYNGSMYYTGFLALTFVFWGVVFRFFEDYKISRYIFMVPCSLIIAGGNYVSLLPTILLLVLMIIRSAFKKDVKAIIALSVNVICQLAGLIVSAMAPGNAIRQSSLVGVTPIKSIKEAIKACFHFTLYWNGFFTFVVFMLLALLFLGLVKKCKFSFKCPILHCLMAFLVFCSCQCPSFYAQNSTGPARLYDICFYMMLLCIAFCEFYCLGFVYRFFEKKSFYKERYLIIAGDGTIVLIFVLLLFVRPMNEANIVPNSIKASAALVNGDAAYLDSQYKERMKIVKGSEGNDVVLEPLEVPEDLRYFIYISDLAHDGTDSVNKAFARCYGLKSVSIGLDGDY